MPFIPTNIPDLVVFEPKIWRDDQPNTSLDSVVAAGNVWSNCRSSATAWETSVSQPWTPLYCQWHCGECEACLRIKYHYIHISWKHACYYDYYYDYRYYYDSTICLACLLLRLLHAYVYAPTYYYIIICLACLRLRLLLLLTLNLYYDYYYYKYNYIHLECAANKTHICIRTPGTHMDFSSKRVARLRPVV